MALFLPRSRRRPTVGSGLATVSSNSVLNPPYKLLASDKFDAAGELPIWTRKL